jgi:ribosomal protein S18 acetylase RimI-like enzyme
MSLSRAMPDGNPTPSGSEFSLRATLSEDAEFLYRVYASTRAEELAMTNWGDAQKEQFCRMQFQAQTTDYRANYPDALHSIIESGGSPVGRLIIDRKESEIRITDIAILPEARNRGIGTRILQELMEEGRAASKALSIHVEKFNPALRLYLRLGFRPIEDKGIYLLMEWKG